MLFIKVSSEVINLLDSSDSIGTVKKADIADKAEFASAVVEV